jgi:hypothetical protein
MKMKLNVIIGLLCLAVTLGSCSMFEKLGTKHISNKRMQCSVLQEVTNNEFNELSSDMYQLSKVEQVNNRLVVSITSDLKIETDKLYWNGFVRSGDVPEASVKIIVSGVASEEGEKESRLCFDVSEMKKHGEQVKIYFMDDEEVFLLDFTEGPSAMK